MVGNGETGDFVSAPSPSHGFLGDGLPVLGDAEGGIEAGPLPCASARGHAAEPWDCPDPAAQGKIKMGEKSRKNNGGKSPKHWGFRA